MKIPEKLNAVYVDYEWIISKIDEIIDYLSYKEETLQKVFNDTHEKFKEITKNITFHEHAIKSLQKQVSFLSTETKDKIFSIEKRILDMEEKIEDITKDVARIITQENRPSTTEPITCPCLCKWKVDRSTMDKYVYIVNIDCKVHGLPE